MPSIKFYYNYAARKSERIDFFNTPTKWTKTLKIYAMRNDYVFEENHNNIDIEPWVLGSTVLSTLSQYKVSGNTSLIVNSDNVKINFKFSDLGRTLGSFIIANDSKPICQLESYEDLPLKIIGESIFINFSNSFEKLFTFDLTTSTVPDIIIHQNKHVSIVAPDDYISRSEGNFDRFEVVDKSSLTGKSAAYRDISITGKAHPLTGDLVTVSGVAAINQSLKVILLANTYDRPFSSKDIAGNINSFLFEFADDITNAELKTGIAVAITNNEPRINLIDIISVNKPESYSIIVTIVYSIKTTNTKQEFTLILERA